MAVQQSDIQPAETDRQWIFPSLQFTCTVNVTGWLFTESSEDFVCPTMELWNDIESTDITTDYRRSVSLTPDYYAQPQKYSEFVYICTLHYPLVVSAGTVIGFLTRTANAEHPKSNVMLSHSGTLVGYNRDVLAAAILINTRTIQTSSARVIPLILPITAGKLNNLCCPKLSVFNISV